MKNARALDILARCLTDGSLGGAEEGDWTNILAFANAHFLVPAMFAALSSSGHLRELPEEVEDYLRLLYRLNGERNAALRQQSMELVGALNAVDVRPILLKGSLALFHGPYAEPAARMIGDIDVMVPPTQLDRSIAILHQLGYHLVNQYPAGHHAYGDFARDGDPGAIDLHVDLIDQPYLLNAAEVWPEVEPVAMGDLQAYAPSPTHRLLHTLLHAQVHHLGNYYRGHIQLRQLHEFASLAQDDGPLIEWEAIDRRLAENRLRTPFDSYLLAAGRLFGLAWPLSRPPVFAARLHAQRCLLQLRYGTPEPVATLWGNLRGAFAWHRMHALYGDGGSGRLLHWQIEHALRFMRRRNMDQVMGRLFRTE